jgi:DNA-binding response OmpR family regulator
MMSVQGVDVDPAARRVWRDGLEIRMSNKEFDLLHALISRPGEIVTREWLMRNVWQTNFWTSAKTIDVHLGWVRKKLGDDTRRPTLITTIRGRGLRFEVTAPVYAEIAVPTSLATTVPVPAVPAVPTLPVEEIQSAS